MRRKYYGGKQERERERADTQTDSKKRETDRQIDGQVDKQTACVFYVEMKIVVFCNV